MSRHREHSVALVILPGVNAMGLAFLSAALVASNAGLAPRAAPSAAAADRPWMDAAKTPDERVELLLPRLSLEEKVNQLVHVWGSVKDADVVARYGNTSVGAMYVAKLDLNASCNVVPACRLAKRNELQRTLIEQSEHGIPISFVSETLHSPMAKALKAATRDDTSTPCDRAVAAACPRLQGAACVACASAHSKTVTPECPTPGQITAACGASGLAHDMGCIFPMPAGQGASWNRTLVRSIAAAIARETRASGADRGFSPELQVCTDPRFGRTQENFGGDPFLVSELGVAATLGLHGGDTSGPTGYLPNFNTTITSEAKHYAAYGFGDADGAPADVSIPTLYDVYLKPWKAYVNAGGRGAMASHNSVNGRPCHSSSWLLTDVFRKELGCDKCFIGTDFRDIELLSNMNTANTSRYAGMPPDTDASIQALAAGIDQDLGGYSYGSLIPATKAGLVPLGIDGQHGIDEACSNVLRSKFAAGLFDQPYTDPALLEQIDSLAHRALAKDAVIDGATLLQNLGGVLPKTLSHLKQVAVVGPLAGCAEGVAQPCDAQRAMAGGYNPDPAMAQIVTVADALTKRLVGSGVVNVVLDTSTSQGVELAVNASTGADLAIVVVGDTDGSCGESDDRMELDLIGNQLDLLEAVLKTGTPTLTVLIHGRPVTFGGSPNSKWAGGSNGLLSTGSGGHAVLSIWRPGEAGGEAVADIILGVSQPGEFLRQTSTSTQ